MGRHRYLRDLISLSIFKDMGEVAKMAEGVLALN
jgi:hypothetical protein